MARETRKIQDHPDLVRDMATQAILNTNPLAIRKHAKYMADKQAHLDHEERISRIEDQLGEIKGLLEALLRK